MEAQITRLKINATNLKNSLVGYNKQLSKLNAEESKLVFNSQRRQIQKQKEESVERSPIGGALENIKSKIVAGPLSFFDKLKEFVGIVLLGVLINNLPALINKLKKFFSDNQWLVDIVKFTFNALDKGIMGMIWLVDQYPVGVMKAMDNERRWVAGEIDKVISLAESAYSIWNKFLNAPPEPPSGTGGPTGGPLPKVPSPAAPSPTAPTAPPAAPSQPSSTPTPASKPKGYAKGGTITSGQRSTIAPKFRGATATPQGRKAIESIDSFENFSTVATGTKINSQLLADKNGINETFVKVNDSFSQFLKLHEKKDKKTSPKGDRPLDEMDPESSRPGSSDPLIPFTAIGLEKEDIIGTIGSTGESSGPHLHIEWGNGWGDRGNRQLSASILNGVFIGGQSLAQIRASGGQGDGLGADRGHRGFDFPAPPGTPITLGPGVRYGDYSHGYNAGYGNVVIVVDSNGQEYLLGHLSGGPSAEALRKIKEKKMNKKAKMALKTIKQGSVDSQADTNTIVVTQPVVQQQLLPMPMAFSLNQQYQVNSGDLNLNLSSPFNQIGK